MYGMLGKPWYLSKTLAFNALALVVLFARAFGFGGFEPDAWVDPMAVILIAVANLALRLVTEQPLR